MQARKKLSSPKPHARIAAFVLPCGFLLCASLLCGAVKTHAQSAADKNAALSLVRAQTRALQTENLNAYMNTIDPRSPSYNSTRQILRQLFDTYDIRYQINSLRVSAITKTVAQVTFDQSTFKVRGPAFQNNRIIGVHTLRRYKGAWKMFATRSDKVIRLK